MSKNLKLSLVLITVAAALLPILLLMGARANPTPEGMTGEMASEELLVRDDSPRLSEGGEAVFVEFLDSECESCIALYPTIEELRAEYGDRVTFVVRHMPLHANSVNAALAA